MKTPIKRLLCGLLCASLSLPMALAANITPSVTTISLPKGENKASFDVILTVDKAFAGAEFGLKPSSDDITLDSLEMLGEIGGNSPVQADKNGIHYFGFFTGSNAYQPGTYKVARLTYRYTGSASRTITLASSKIVTINEDSKTTEGDTSSQPFTVTISRAGTTPSGGGGGGGSTSSSDQTAADAVIKLINAIGTVTENSGNAISSARRSYDALTDAQKKLVTNYDKLTQAEKTFAGLSSDTDKLPFSDMDGHWSYDAVSYVYKHNVMNGTDATHFAPKSMLNRAMMVTILYRMAGSPAVSGANTFSDVANGRWYTDAVQWAAANGVVNGIGNGRFAPDTQITREQMASMMMRYAQWKQYATNSSSELSGFSDVNVISSWALPAMKWAHASGLISGRTANTIAPRDTATRAEAATILMRFMQNNS
jgi:hypothetical protein